MHMHLVMFQVLDRQAFEILNGNVVPIGSPVAPPPHEAGWKDTVQVGPNEIVRVIAHFENYAGRFPYHCHILEHEDHEMMRQFETVASVAACQDGIDNDGDGDIDFSGFDPGCSSATDLGEHEAAFACDDGIDTTATAPPISSDRPAILRPPKGVECDDGVDNTATADRLDGSPDPECTVAFHDDESVVYVPEPSVWQGLLAGGVLLAWLHRRRRRANAGC
jgi:hypothetical protein